MASIGQPILGARAEGGIGLAQVPAVGAPAEPAPPDEPEEPREQPRGQGWDRALERERPREGARVAAGERSVGGQRGVARALAGQHRAQLAAAGDAEVERGADALAREREAVAGAVADEEHAVLDRRAQLVREPVALVADGRPVQAPRDLARRLLDVVARLVGADADALLIARGDAPGVSVAHERAV